MIFVVLRGDNGFKEHSSAGFNGVGRSQEKPKRIISREAFLLWVWVAFEFSFNQQTPDSAHLSNHHQEFLQLQLVCNFYLEGEFKLQNQQFVEKFLQIKLV